DIDVIELGGRRCFEAKQLPLADVAGGAGREHLNLHQALHARYWSRQVELRAFRARKLFENRVSARQRRRDAPNSDCAHKPQSRPARRSVRNVCSPAESTHFVFVAKLRSSREPVPFESAAPTYRTSAPS